ncbi:MAG: putative ABC transporter permease, partial [Agathobacter sp.]|nr:putative ABC transporter permease [Agathobacter sp.]
DNRSMYFPFLLGYGIGIVLIYLIMGTPDELHIFGKKIVIESKAKRILLYLLEDMILVSVGEIVIGTVVENVCGFEWWNYSSYPLHITKYTSVPTSFLFASLITIFMNFGFSPLLKFFEGWNETVLKVVAIVLMIIMIGDFLYAAYQMYQTNWLLIRWRIILNEELFLQAIQ